MPFETVTTALKRLKAPRAATTLDDLRDLAEESLRTLTGADGFRPQGTIDDDGTTLEYGIYTLGEALTRPIREDLFVRSVEEFRSDWDHVVAGIRPGEQRIVADLGRANRALYTCAMAVAAAYDLWRPKARKTPGTFFEIMANKVLTTVTERKGLKQIRIPNANAQVPTDLVLASKSEGRPNLVVASKITTRERVVQPWAHQRILDSVFGVGSYHTILVCGSELQRDGDRGVREVCVPRQIALFQAHVSHLAGMYYLDPPVTYRRQLTGVIRVGTVAQLLVSDLPGILGDQGLGSPTT